MKVNKYPVYLYHKEYNDPRIANNKAQQTDLENKGWTTRYIYKEYPKMVNGVLCKTEEAEKFLLAEAEKIPKMKVEVHKTVKDQHGNIVAETGKPATVVTEPPTGKINQVPASFEIVGPDGKVIQGKEFATWKDAQSKQKALNEAIPGHKARKKV